MKKDDDRDKVSLMDYSCPAKGLDISFCLLGKFGRNLFINNGIKSLDQT